MVLVYNNNNNNNGNNNNNKKGFKNNNKNDSMSYYTTGSQSLTAQTDGLCRSVQADCLVINGLTENAGYEIAGH